MICRSCGAPNDKGALKCTSCGGTDLSRRPQAAIGCVARAVAWGLALASLRLLFAGGWLARSAAWAFKYVFGRSFASVAESFATVVVTLGTLALMAECAVGDRVPVFGPYVRSVGRLVAFVPRAAWRLARALFLVVEGRPLPEPKKPKPGTRGEER